MKLKTAATWLALTTAIQAIILDACDPRSIRNAAKTIAQGAQELYKGHSIGGTMGKWPFPPYYWWESGAAWGSMLQYFINTGDPTYNVIIYQALVSQLGPAYNFINQAQFYDTGNDDQAFWVFNAMTMAEYGFPAPPAPGPPWVKVVENAWTQFVNRWNTTYCNGGLKWQFQDKNIGFNYKQTISNGAFFQISARLARYTGDDKYLNWAEKIWQWSRDIGLIDQYYNVYDGSDELDNCTGIDHHQWSYNIGVFLYGSAVLSNLTTASNAWTQRTVGLLNATSTFFTPFLNSTDVMFEPACEPNSSCNTDQQSMKAYLARWLANTSLMAPYTADRIGQYLRASAQGAASACSGGFDGKACGTKWYINAYDGQSGLGQQIAAMEIIGALLVNQTAPPGTMSNVRVNRLPSTVTDIASAPTGLARPLHDPLPTQIKLFSEPSNSGSAINADAQAEGDGISC